MTTDDLVTHLLKKRHMISNHEFIATLALWKLRPTPRQRLHPQELMTALQITQKPYLSRLLRSMARHDLVEYEPGTAGEPGYLFWRVGPKQ